VTNGQIQLPALLDLPRVDLMALDEIQRRVLWLATMMVHHANHVRPNPGRIKVGGHQASSASTVSILTALFFHHLRAGDRVAIKPHAAPAYHAVQYLLGNLSQEKLTTLRAYGGLQAYPSRTKDLDYVDFSTGSVGLGAVAPVYAAFTHAYTRAHFGDAPPHRSVALLGDAELDEGSIWETAIDPVMQQMGNLVWIVDLNRQSLDRVVPGVRANQLRKLFAACGWQVLEAKFGTQLQQIFKQPGGEMLRRHIDEMSNEEYQHLIRMNGAALRRHLITGEDYARMDALLADVSDEHLPALLANLGGHDLQTLIDVLAQADADTICPAVIFAYTIKGWGLPIAADPLNHAALLTADQIAALAP
jgi:pyruvate dehydrogenase E1 component